MVFETTLGNWEDWEELLHTHETFFHFSTFHRLPSLRARKEAPIFPASSRRQLSQQLNHRINSSRLGGMGRRSRSEFGITDIDLILALVIAHANWLALMIDEVVDALDQL